MIEEIKAKADELGQFYFPDECNVWARYNMEAKFVSSACIEMAEWMQGTTIEKARKWILCNMPKYVKANRLDVFINNEDMANDFKQAMEE
jgi:hypothetical protein